MQKDLRGTILHCAILTKVSGLTVNQLRSAQIDDTTQLPDYIDRTQL